MTGSLKRKIGGILIFAAWLVLSGFARAEDYAAGNAGYLKSATYYSDDWVVNFWNSESRNMDQELAQIAADGFNNIILVIPWREFQPSTNPVSYSTYTWKKLDRVMEAAQSHNLSVMLRVGYTWDYWSEDDVQNRYQALLYDESTWQAWLAYVEKLYQTASAHENFCGGFLTWEDFWNFTYKAVSMGSGQASRVMASRSGYTDYVRSHSTLEEVSALYGRTITSWSYLYFPERDSPAMKLFYEFYNDFLNRLLEASQQVFPDLSFEVRLDGDLVMDQNGTPQGYMHSDTFPCQNASYSTTVYSVPMGQENNSEKLTAGQALAAAPAMLGNLKNNNNGKPVYIDQFLFTDNTPGFEENAQLLEEEKPVYLQGMIPVLKNMTMGYGIWTYRNYCNNKVFNAQFALGQERWTMTGGSSVENRGGNMQARIRNGGSISQSLGSRATSKDDPVTRIRFWAESTGSSDIIIQAGQGYKVVQVTEGRRVEVAFASAAVDRIQLSCSGADVFVDDIQVYTTVTDGELYDLDGNPLSCIPAVRQMNQVLN